MRIFLYVYSVLLPFFVLFFVFFLIAYLDFKKIKDKKHGFFVVVVVTTFVILLIITIGSISQKVKNKIKRTTKTKLLQFQKKEEIPKINLY